MIRAVFLDYTGTMVREDEPYTRRMVKLFIENSDLDTPEKAFAAVWGLIRKSEWEHYGDTFILKDEMADNILAFCRERYHLTADTALIHDIWRNVWIHAPLFDDVEPFMKRCRLPVYIVTNDDLKYITLSLREKGLSPAGVISAEMVRANKPHREILDEALRVSGVSPDEAVLIGDSEESDVKCAAEVGITPILLDRKGRSKRTDIRVIRSLDELDF